MEVIPVFLQLVKVYVPGILDSNMNNFSPLLIFEFWLVLITVNIQIQRIMATADKRAILTLICRFIESLLRLLRLFSFSHDLCQLVGYSCVSLSDSLPKIQLLGKRYFG